jgi:hypothetical protein
MTNIIIYISIKTEEYKRKLKKIKKIKKKKLKKVKNSLLAIISPIKVKK